MNESEKESSTEDLRTQILNTTLAEAQARHQDGDDEVCVICLEALTEKAQAQPCRHTFDFLCLLSWLEERPSCPLCKSTLTTVRYAFRDDKFSTYTVPTPAQKPARGTPARSQRRGFTQPRRPLQRQTLTLDAAIARRKEVYAHNLYSLHVGANRISRYENLTPAMIAASSAQLSRARKWIRRELRAFDFLSPNTRDSRAGTSSTGSGSGSGINNAEFLLEYIVAIVRTVDLRGAQGQAHEMLSEFLGGDTARLFIHELSSWLRSPYEDLEGWDSHVQYPAVSTPSATQQGEKRDVGGHALEENRKRRRVDRYVPNRLR